MDGDGERDSPATNQGGESSSPGGAGAGNIKIVHPVPRELNPNAKPFRSAKLELRTLLSQQVRGHDPIDPSSINPYATARADRNDMSNGEVGAHSRMRRTSQGAGISGHTSPFGQNDMNSRPETELIANFSRWKFRTPTEMLTVGDAPAANHNFWNSRNYQGHTMNFPSRVAPPRSGGGEHSRASPGLPNLLESNNSSNSMDLLLRISNRLEEQTRFQADCSRQLHKLDRKLGLVTTRLDRLEDRKRESLNSYDGAAHSGQRGNSSSSKAYFGMNPDTPDYWGYQNFESPQVPTGEQEDIFSTGNEASLRNNLTLNNQVPPGTRANNFYDNFRSYSQQNLLSAPKNIPGTMGRGRDSNSIAGNLYSGLFDQCSRPRDSSSESGELVRKSGTPRNSFRGAEFVENIGTKLRNQEQEIPPSHSRSPMRRNDNSASSIRSRSPDGRDRDRNDQVGSSFGADAEGESLKSIMDVISVFLERNGNRHSFIFSLFERLNEVRSDFQRSVILNSLDAILNNSEPCSSYGMDQQESQPPLSVPNWARHMVDDLPHSRSVNEGRSRTRGVVPLNDFGQSASSNPLPFDFGSRHHRPPFDYTSYQNNLKFKSREEPGKVRPMGISPAFSVPREPDRSPIETETMGTSPEDEYRLGPILYSNVWGPRHTPSDGWERNRTEVGPRSLLFDAGQPHSSKPSTITGAGDDAKSGDDDDSFVPLNGVKVDELVSLPGARSNYFLPMDYPASGTDEPEQLESESDVENEVAGEEDEGIVTGENTAAA